MKLITLNVERNQHLDRIIPFFDREDADAVCLQESTMEYVSELKKRNYTIAHAPLNALTQSGESIHDGITIATKVPFVHTTHHYYEGGFTDELSGPKHRARPKQSYLFATIEHAGITYNIATTHFTWSPDGYVASEYQKSDMAKLKQMLSKHPAHILCGDFNLPRKHNELYDILVEGYSDAIPSDFRSSLDKKFHRVGKSNDHQHLFSDFMVDYLLTQQPFTVKNVRMEFGLSDHAGVVAEISTT